MIPGICCCMVLMTLIPFLFSQTRGTVVGPDRAAGAIRPLGLWGHAAMGLAGGGTGATFLREPRFLPYSFFSLAATGMRCADPGSRAKASVTARICWPLAVRP